MARDLESGLAEALAERVVRPFLAVHINFPDPIHGWTGTGEIAFNDAVWTGMAGIAAIDPIGESTDGSATGFSVTLNQIPSDLADYLVDQSQRGVAFEIYVGALDETMQTIIGVKLAWRGTLQSYKILDAGDTLTVTAAGESRMIDQRRPAIKRFTDAYQQAKYPGDKFFEYVPQLVDVPILWAKANQNSPLSGGPSAFPGFGGFGGFSF
ncbi:MAG: hypothetical protein V4618_00885 [Pseudomonadota bacterium]